MAHINTLFDDFDDNSKDSAKWATTAALLGVLFFTVLGGSVSEVGGAVAVTTPEDAEGVNGYSSLAIDYDCIDGDVIVKITPPGLDPVATPGHAFLIVADPSDEANGASHYAQWEIHYSRFGTTSISATYNNSGSAGTAWTAEYSFTDHRWLRIHVTASDLYWYTAADVDGAPGAWVLRRQITVDAGTPADYVAFDSAAVGFFAQSDNDAQDPHVWLFDNFNVTEFGPALADEPPTLRRYDGAAWVPVKRLKRQASGWQSARLRRYA